MLYEQKDFKISPRDSGWYTGVMVIYRYQSSRNTYRERTQGISMQGQHLLWAKVDKVYTVYYVICTTPNLNVPLVLHESCQGRKRT